VSRRDAGEGRDTNTGSVAREHGDTVTWERTFGVWRYLEIKNPTYTSGMVCLLALFLVVVIGDDVSDERE
jgi:hypothetical protein